MKGDDLSQDLLVSLFDYDHRGFFTWKERLISMANSDADCRRWNSKYAGSRAGCTKNGYEIISIKEVQYPTHRLVWIYFHGSAPKGQIDHINHARSDNRIENLREVTNQENNKNCPIRSTNTSGVTGVYWNTQKGKWQAFITVDGKAVSLGRFSDKEQAITVRKAASEKYGYHPNHGAKV